MRHQLLHQECIPHCVHSWHNNLVKCHFLWDGWRIFDFFSPQFPFTHPLKKQNTGRQIHSTTDKFRMRGKVEWKIWLPLLQSEAIEMILTLIRMKIWQHKTHSYLFRCEKTRFETETYSNTENRLWRTGKESNLGECIDNLTSPLNQEILKTKNKTRLKQWYLLNITPKRWLYFGARCK